MEKMVILPDGTPVPAIGQGTWFLGEQKEKHEEETETLRTGIEAGMTLIDTAEMYGNGKAEKLIGEAIRGLDRSRLFLVSKVYPHNAGRKNIFKSCMDSMARLNTDYLDLYLLHWRGGIPLKETVECMEQLKKEGKIRRWGVSNFDTDDMEELWSVPQGENCAVNQVLYHVASRGIEYDLLPWMRRHGVPVMAYCPLAQAGDLKRGLYENPVLSGIAKARKCTISQILLAFVIRDGGIIAIPRTGKKEHASDNGKAGELQLTEEELKAIDRAFPAPDRKVYLDIV
ncbi:aldo/keto reductase [Lachnospiraceae bacterium 54-53]